MLFDSGRTDGYYLAGNVVQGARGYDSNTEQWTTPDAYKGDVHDPMSQRSYMWNNNNPVQYSDPSGYLTTNFHLDGVPDFGDDNSPDTDSDFWASNPSDPDIAKRIAEDQKMLQFWTGVPLWLLAPILGPEEAGGAALEGALGDHIVLGLAKYGLKDTAAQVGGRTLGADWMSELRAGIADPSTKFTLSLDGFSGTSPYDMVMSAAQKGLSGSSGYTEWEVGQLYQSGRLFTTNFVQNGASITINFSP